MGDNKYDPEVYKRLELVRKQFRTNTAEQKKQEAAERRQDLMVSLERNKIKIGRLITYTFLALLVLAVIGVMVAKAVMG